MRGTESRSRELGLARWARAVALTRSGADRSQPYEGSSNNFVARLLLLRVNQQQIPHLFAAMLHLIGLGLADEKDVTVRGLEIIKKAERVYLEAYTAVLLVSKEQLVSALLPIPRESPQGLTSMLCDSRKPSMAALSSLPTAKWSSLPATTSWKMLIKSTSPSSLSVILSGV